MRCLKCNALLTEDEATHKVKGVYMDTCFTCLYGDSPGEDDSLDFGEEDLPFEYDQLDPL